MANKMPIAAAVPIWANGGDSLKFNAKKLMAVVTLVKIIGLKLISILFSSARFLSRPLAKPWE